MRNKYDDWFKRRQCEWTVKMLHKRVINKFGAFVDSIFQFEKERKKNWISNKSDSNDILDPVWIYLNIISPISHDKRERRSDSIKERYRAVKVFKYECAAYIRSNIYSYFFSRHIVLPKIRSHAGSNGRVAADSVLSHHLFLWKYFLTKRNRALKSRVVCDFHYYGIE